MPRTSPPRKDKNRVPRQKRELPVAAPKEAERVAKVVARAGLGSRREIEDWIAEGRVAVNGTVLTSPAVTVTPEDSITVDGEKLPERERTRLFIYHKPAGVVTTNRDPEGRATLFEILPKGLPRLVSVGRLDLTSEGLLLLTNDGGLARVLELPETGWLRRYRVRANGEIDQARLDTLLSGITVDGIAYGPIEATLDRVQGANAWITVSLREGKNREVRNVLGALGLRVNRLIRVSYGPFQLGDIPEGGIEEVRTRVLRDQIGTDIAAAAGADFEGPLVERELDEAPPRAPLRPAGRRQAEADKAGGLKKPARRGTRDHADFDAPAEDVIRPAPAQRQRRRTSEERDLESRGTVADRNGRSVKVERVVADPERPARGRRPADEGGRPPRRFGGEGEAGRGRRGPAEGGRSFRDRPGDEREDFRRRPTRSGEGDERPRRSRPTGDEAPRGRFGGDERPAGRGPRRAEGDRPFRARPEGDDRPRRSRPAGDEAPRGRFGGDERPAGRGPRRAEGDRPFRARPEGEDRPRRSRPAGDEAPRGRFGGDERPAGRGPRRTEGDRPFRARPEGEDRPRRARADGGAPPRDRFGGDGRPEGRGFGERPGAKPTGRFGAKPAGKPGGKGGPKGPPKGGKFGGKPAGRPGGKSGGKSGGKPGGPRGRR